LISNCPVKCGANVLNCQKLKLMMFSPTKMSATAEK
jgi:hypothetical protein